MELTQILLVSVIIILTILLIIVGTEVFLVLKDLRTSIKKTHKILDDSTGKQIGVSQILGGLKNTVETVQKIAKTEVPPIKVQEEIKDDLATLEEKAKEIISSKPSPIHRFFKKGGKKLSKG